MAPPWVFANEVLSEGVVFLSEFEQGALGRRENNIIVIRPKSRVSIGLLVVSAALVFQMSGCAFWRDFTTYFNVLYLARQHMDAYEEQMNSNVQQQAQAAATPQTSQPVQNTPNSQNPQIPQNAQNAQSAQQVSLSHRWLDEEYETRQTAQHAGNPTRIQASFLRNKPTPKGAGSSIHLDSAIILGSKILANKQGSKYVEDALFIVGKAQFYKNDFSGAKRKFLELLTHYPNTKYGSAVQMFLARSMLGSNGLDTAMSALHTAVKMAEADHDMHTLGDAHRTLAEIIYAKNQDSLKAIAAELDSAQGYYTGEEAARLSYEAGIINYLDGSWSDASDNFARAAKQTGDASLEGDARIDHALALRRMGKFDEAIKELTFVSEKSKFSSVYPPAKYELAYTSDLAARAAVANDLRSAEYRNHYYPLVQNDYYVVDTTFLKQSQAIVSRSKFREAEILRGMAEYDSASRYALPLIGTKEFSNVMMNDYVSERMRSLAKFATWRNELTMLDTVERQLQSVRKGVDVVKRSDAALHQEAMREVLGARYSSGAPVDLTPSEKSQVAQTEARLKTEQSSKTALQHMGSDTTRFLDSIHYRMANDHYELGRAYENFRELPTARNEYLAALAYHPVLLDSNADIFKAEVIFTWLQLEAGEKNIRVRDSLMQVLARDYGQSIYARQAMALYGGPRDTNAPGEVAYRASYNTLRSGGLDPAKPQFLGVVAGYVHEDVAPRSLFAIGTTYEEAERFDSAVVYYKRVLFEYPYSPYADALRPRLADIGITSKVGTQTARRYDPNIQSDAEKEQDQADKARQQRQQELLKEQEKSRMFKMPGSDNGTNGSDTTVNNPNGVPPPPQNGPPPLIPGGSNSPFGQAPPPLKKH